jgi:bifunctional non-homologous end joining protein LigD
MVKKGRPGPAPRSPETRKPSRSELNQRPYLSLATLEADHFYNCPHCNERVDRRRLGDVLHHEQPGHEPIAERSGDVAALKFVEPMMPALVDEPPEGDQWLHEIKYDGYRTQVILANGTARAFTRRGFDWTEKYAPIVACAQMLPCTSAIIEGEMIMQDKEGRSDFHALRAGIETQPKRLIMMAFDLLHLNSEDLRRQPVERRRELLRRLLGPNEPHRPIHFSEHVIGNGRDFFAAVDGMGLEGIVSKKLGSRYRSGSTKSWLKTKCYGEEELVLIGTSKGDRAPVALLAREEAGQLVYAGGAMISLPQPDRATFWEAAERIRSPEPPIPMEPRKETGWVRPEMRVRVRTLRGEEMLRHATVTEITALPTRRVARSNNRGSSQEPHFARPEIDHAAIADYYQRMAGVILPWIANRPLNIVRCGEHSCWYQRNVNHPKAAPSTFPPAIRRVPVLQKNGKTEEYLYIEFHGWGSSVQDIERPDRIAIDLDPDEALDFEAVKEAAFDVHQALERLDLESFALLTGGKGIHVVVPITPRDEWPEVREFVRSFCQALAEAEPHRFTIALPKAERRGRIFLDYLRNQRTSTAILPYSVRARQGMSVAAPIAWSELAGIDGPHAFSVSQLAKLKRRASSRLLAGWGLARQALPRAQK